MELLKSNSKAVKFDLFGPQLSRIEAPAFALVVLIPVQAAPRNPLPILKRPFVHGRDANLLPGRRSRYMIIP